MIDYHPSKANVVADALSRKTPSIMAHIRVMHYPLFTELKTLGIELGMNELGVLLAHFKVRPILVDRIREFQFMDPNIMKLMGEVSEGLQTDFWIRGNGMLMMGNRLCVPGAKELKREILEEAHLSAYAMHLGSTRLYHTLKEHYWWPGMKREVAEFVSRCLVCQQVKAEHQRPAGLSQPLPIPRWKWEHITMDFVIGLPHTTPKHDGYLGDYRSVDKFRSFLTD
ncbi:hypothetical protein Patl1_07805 [Pistacia atlantica]|uniref:Uncharacterized protein n=1 Tax=Pistacia atlantica TaxID=434234 RepID=A0ACC1AH13_9ROSI|nr:hypothetical protein Patl1_07805 [Pistacia atlantica]